MLSSGPLNDPAWTQGYGAQGGATLEQRKDAVVEVKFITEVVITREVRAKV